MYLIYKLIEDILCNYMVEKFIYQGLGSVKIQTNNAQV